MLPRTTFALGGAASGKSEWAEGLVNSSGLPKTYLATGRIWDDEVQERVKKHQARRDAGWRTVECPLDLTEPLAKLPAGEIVLIDCATMWLSNHLMEGSDLAEAQAALGQEIVTPVLDAKPFYLAEDFHQNYYKSSKSTLTRFGYISRADAYKRYREACGRDDRVRALWGEDAPFVGG